ncbi:MAG: hypothetical protein Q4B58_08625 [Bacteroidales bacterium]|nr:hypothetical protein [Bacteroidales bacterium]
MKKNYFFIGALASLMLVSCTNSDDVANENTIGTSKNESAIKAEYAKNFAAKFGNVKSTQNWDLSTQGRKYGSQAAPDAKSRAVVSSASRSGESRAVVSEGKQETFSEEFRKAISKVLPEGKNNSAMGYAHEYLSQGPFDIYPIWHGYCMEWDLYINEEFIGSYSDIMAQMGEDTEFRIGDTNEISPKGWHIDLPEGTPLLFKLVITNPAKGYGVKEGDFAHTGDIITSIYNPQVPWKGGFLSHGSLWLTWDKMRGIQKPDNLDLVAMFEDAKTIKGDADFNDFILGIKGRPNPPEIIVFDTTTYTCKIPSTVTKRYMVEDLGNTDDFDFNDIVFNITDSTTDVHFVETIRKYHLNGYGDTIRVEETINDEIIETKRDQFLTLKHLGGTLEFSVQVGNKTPIARHEGVLGQDYNDRYVLEGNPWLPESHNIKVYIFNPEIGSKPVEITFPTIGDPAPMILAFDRDKKWSAERVAITKEWFEGE